MSDGDQTQTGPGTPAAGVGAPVAAGAATPRPPAPPEPPVDEQEAAWERDPTVAAPEGVSYGEDELTYQNAIELGPTLWGEPAFTMEHALKRAGFHPDGLLHKDEVEKALEELRTCTIVGLTDQPDVAGDEG